ncbi:MAG TPA: hypothetical protein VG796_28505 [Verrucomicrobiales bacterium]|nr:hypothetical protein [Verrucomicrobiales bacterium]
MAASSDLRECDSLNVQLTANMEEPGSSHGHHQSTGRIEADAKIDRQRLRINAME